MENLIDGFASLPGIGRKSAQRLAFHVLSLPQEEADRFANAVLEAKKSVHTCPVCQNLTDGELCPVCASDSRDKTTICVVSEPRDVLSIERSREYHGVYHVLHGALSPMNRVGPDDLRIRELLERVAQGGVEEVILATNPDTEGDATAMYLSRLLKPFGIRITRLGFGVPVGSNLEYADDATSSKRSKAAAKCNGGINLPNCEHNPVRARPVRIHKNLTFITGVTIILWHKN